MAKKYPPKCSSSLAIREMKIKSMLRFHFTPVRMAKINKPSDNGCWRGFKGKGTLSHGWWDCQLVQMEISMENPQKQKINLPHDPPIPLLGICTKDWTSVSQIPP